RRVAVLCSDDAPGEALLASEIAKIIAITRISDASEARAAAELSALDRVPDAVLITIGRPRAMLALSKVSRIPVIAGGDLGSSPPEDILALRESGQPPVLVMPLRLAKEDIRAGLKDLLPQWESSGAPWRLAAMSSGNANPDLDALDSNVLKVTIERA